MEFDWPDVHQVQLLDDIPVKCRPNQKPPQFGKIKTEPIRVFLHPNAVPVQCGARQMPQALYDKVKLELERMVKLGVIKPVNHATNWCHPPVIVAKKWRCLSLLGSKKPEQIRAEANDSPPAP